MRSCSALKRRAIAPRSATLPAPRHRHRRARATARRSAGRAQRCERDRRVARRPRASSISRALAPPSRRARRSDAARCRAGERRLEARTKSCLKSRHQHPGGAEDRRLARHEQQRDLELGGDRRRVHAARRRPRRRAGSRAGRGRGARVTSRTPVAIADVDEVVDARRRLARSRRPSGVGDVLGSPAAPPSTVEPHAAAEEARRRRGSRARGRRRSSSARCRRARSRRGRARRRRSAGPTWSRPPSSTRAIEPPPAPIVWMSIVGSASRQRSTTPSVIDRAARPSVTSATSKLVPPMSIVRQSRSPAAASCQSPAVGPEAGPESSESAARRRPRRASRRRRSTA